MTEVTRKRILVVEDESAIAETILFALETEGFEAQRVATGREALAQLGGSSFDLLLLDVGLPDMNGIELCKTIRARSQVPVFFLTARASEVDRVVGLEVGGDDYIAKPFSPRELTARIKALFRRLSSATPALGAKPLAFRLDETRARIQLRGQDLELTKTEYNLLKLFVSRPGRVFSRQEIMERISDHPDMSLERTIDSHVKFLRAKLRERDPDHDWIITHRGFGYSLAEE